jgi:hypothetical protein
MMMEMTGIVVHMMIDLVIMMPGGVDRTGKQEKE